MVESGLQPATASQCIRNGSLSSHGAVALLMRIEIPQLRIASSGAGTSVAYRSIHDAKRPEPADRDHLAGARRR